MDVSADFDRVSDCLREVLEKLSVARGETAAIAGKIRLARAQSKDTSPGGDLLAAALAEELARRARNMQSSQVRALLAIGDEGEALLGAVREIDRHRMALGPCDLAVLLDKLMGVLARIDSRRN